MDSSNVRGNMPEKKAQQKPEKEDLKEVSSGKKVCMGCKTALSRLLQSNAGLEVPNASAEISGKAYGNPAHLITPRIKYLYIYI